MSSKPKRVWISFHSVTGNPYAWLQPTAGGTCYVLEAAPETSSPLRDAARLIVGEPECVQYPKRGVYGAKIEPDTPFWSEAALYELLGKEAARTLLAWRNGLVAALQSPEKTSPSTAEKP